MILCIFHPVGYVGACPLQTTHIETSFHVDFVVFLNLILIYYVGLALSDTCAEVIYLPTFSIYMCLPVD